MQADLADLDRAASIVAEAVAGLGRLTGLVNNAGITGRIGPFLETTTEESELVLRINVLAPLVITRAAIAHLIAHGGGSIVNISSGAATTGAPHTYIPYAMSKAALNLLTVGAAKEFAADWGPGEHGVAGHDVHRDPRRRRPSERAGGAGTGAADGSGRPSGGDRGCSGLLAVRRRVLHERRGHPDHRRLNLRLLAGR